MSKAIIMYGDAGAGKNVVAKKIKLVARRDAGVKVKNIESGPYFRAHKDLCQKAKKGELVENHLVMDFFQKQILICGKCSVIIDSPRTDDQVALLVEMLTDLGYTEIYGVFVDTSERNCRQRLVDRAHKEHRDDDKCMKAIETRLSTFRERWAFVVSAIQKYVKPENYYKLNGDKDIYGLETEASVVAHEVFGFRKPRRRKKFKGNRKRKKVIFYSAPRHCARKR